MTKSMEVAVKEPKKEVSVLKNYSLDKPAEIVAMANVLKQHIVKNNLYTNIKGKNYVQVEGWAFAGFLTGLNAVIKVVDNLSTENEIKWSATAEVFYNGNLISTGFALCSNREAIKKSFDEYAILSMAQTRAIGKAYRNKLGWVMKLAGYESTPSDEMKKVDGREADLPTEKSEKVKEVKEVKSVKKYFCGQCQTEITEAENNFSMKIHKVPACRDCQKLIKK